MCGHYIYIVEFVENGELNMILSPFSFRLFMIILMDYNFNSVHEILYHYVTAESNIFYQFTSHIERNGKH